LSKALDQLITTTQRHNDQPNISQAFASKLLNSLHWTTNPYHHQLFNKDFG